jgi:hypothetical protein
MSHDVAHRYGRASRNGDTRRWHEDRHAEGRSGMPAKWAMVTLMMLAGPVAIASMIH